MSASWIAIIATVALLIIHHHKPLILGDWRTMVLRRTQDGGHVLKIHNLVHVSKRGLTPIGYWDVNYYTVMEIV